jgi:GMP synthase-like glutamine amidotransferase
VTDAATYNEGVNSSRPKARLEQASGEPCLIIPFEKLTLSLVNRLRPRAIVMSGFGRHFESRDIRSFCGMDDIFHKTDIPILAICGSHQLMAFAFTRPLRRTNKLRDQPMRRLKPNEEAPRVPCADPDYDLSPFYVAQGFFPIRRVKSDPIFNGLPPTIIMRCSHYCEVRKLPRDLLLLATGGHCKIEMMRHKTRPVYGVQFHPENYEKPFMHGRKLLENFAAVVNSFWRAAGQ